jgi:hypothetical protein
LLEQQRRTYTGENSCSDDHITLGCRASFDAPYDSLCLGMISWSHASTISQLDFIHWRLSSSGISGGAVVPHGVEAYDAGNDSAPPVGRREASLLLVWHTCQASLPVLDW